jgi:hypothetical protein
LIVSGCYAKRVLLNCKSIDLNQVIKEMVVMMGDEASRHTVTIRTDLAAGTPLCNGRSRPNATGVDEPDAKWY